MQWWIQHLDFGGVRFVTFWRKKGPLPAAGGCTQGSQRLEAEFPEICENFRKYAIFARKRHDFEEKYMFLKGPISGNPEISGTLGALAAPPDAHTLFTLLHIFDYVRVKVIYSFIRCAEGARKNLLKL